MSPVTGQILLSLHMGNFCPVTGNSNTLSAIKINVLLFTCVPVPFLSRLDFNEAKAVIGSLKFRVTSLNINPGHI